jgi:hypothetical protein
VQLLPFLQALKGPLIRAGEQGCAGVEAYRVA